ncbi:gamma-aminobutyrate:proton symporter (AAT family) [Scopulibacillus darangshiensis]|uniref:Gamma-aminobutyrate:proton symporter (AAT family) n=1 Tax=Scopulibacillus darangshiensis TaxID=442528 RepID=A0A4R2P2Q2_9BACL|nr:amino acid permease [Scopulibacillus darangshiensis]TCP29003.1 gamma-aminobutyrate:proton symporter (AAT family) [Scopulibacillus darangshiensis]
MGAKKDNLEMKQSLKTRHMTMIALGGVIGAGLFVGSGVAIHEVGPGILLSYILSGLLVFMIMRILGEMATTNPTSGSFSEYAREAIGPWAGITVGWLYWFQWVVVIAIEAIAGASIIQSWIPGFPLWIITLLLTFLLTLTNIFSVKSFGEFEYWFSMIKVVSIILFLCLGISLIFGIPFGSPEGFSNLVRNDGFLPHGSGAVLLGIVIVIFSFTGTEVTTIAAAESKDPEKSVSRAINSTIWRVLIFYIGSIAVVVTLLPWNSADVLKSPFVAVLDNIGIPFAGQIMNVIVLIAVLSCLNSGLYTTSRMLFSLAKKGDAPRLFLKLNKKGVPARGVFAATIFSYLGVIMNFVSPEVVFMFLVNASGAIILLVYLFIAVSQLRMRKKYEKENRGALKMKMWLYPYLTYATIIAILGILSAMAFIKSTQSQLFSTLILAAAIIVVSVIVGKNKRTNETLKETNDNKFVSDNRMN